MVTYAIVTISDKAAQGKRADRSGKIIREMFENRRVHLLHSEIVPDEKDQIQCCLKKLADELKIRLVLTTGGTGFSERDITPEATREIIEREVPGFGEIMRVEGYKKTPMALLSRGISGIRGKTLIINLPGSSQGVKDSLELIMPVLEHGLGILKKNRDHEDLGESL